MTDNEGIIQKVFNKWINTRHNQNSKFYYLKNNTQDGLIELEKELIEEIKKKFADYPYVGYGDKYDIILQTTLRTLIGDNQE